MAFSTEPMPAHPAKLTEVPSTQLARYDIPAFNGGILDAQFLSSDAVVCGYQHSSEVLTLSKQTNATLWSGGSGVSVAASGDRYLLAQPGALALFDAATHQPLRRWRTNLQRGAGVRFSPDGALAAAWSVGGVLELWDTRRLRGVPKALKPELTSSDELPRGKPLASLSGHAGAVCCVSFSPDGKRLASGDTRGQLLVSELPSGRKKRTFAFGQTSVRGAAWTPAGHLAVALESGEIRVVSLDGRSVKRWSTHDAAWDARMLENGVLAVVGTKTLSLWDSSKGRLLARSKRKRSVARSRIGDVRGDLILALGPAQLLRVS